MCGKSSTPNASTYASTTSGGTGATGATTLPASPLTAGLYNQVLQGASNLGQTPFNPATLGQLTAWTPEQQASAEQLYTLGMNAGVFNPDQIQQIMSPYIQDVVNATQAQFNTQNAQQANQLIGQAIQSGNIFGGDRAGVAAAQLAGQQQTAQAPVIAGLYQSGYGQALQQANLLTQMGLQGAQTAFGGASLYPQYQQQALNLAQQNAIQQSAYPFQLANWQASVAGGLGPLTGTTGTTNYNTASYLTPPAPNPYTQGLGYATTALSAVPMLAKRGGLVGYDHGGRIPLAHIIDDTVPHRQGGGLAPAQPLQLMQVRMPGGMMRSDGSGGLQQGASTMPQGGVPGALGDFITAAGKAWPVIKDYFHPTALGTAVQTSTTDDSVPMPTPRPPAASTPAYEEHRGGLIPHRQGGGSGIGTPYDAISIGGQPGAPGNWMGAPRTAAGQPLGLMQVSIPDPMKAMLPKDGSSSGSSGSSGTSGGLTGLVNAGVKALPYLATLFAERGGRIPHRQEGGGDIDPEEGAPYQVAGEPIASGRMTWFNPRMETGGYGYRDPATGQVWYDAGAAANREGLHASGLSGTTPGIALPNRETLGQPVVAVLPDGRRVLTTQTDIGPRGVVDLNAALASRVYPGGPGTVPGGLVRVERPDANDMQALAFNTVDPNVDPVGAAVNQHNQQVRTAQAVLQPGVTTIPGFAPRPRTKLEEWAQSPLLRAGEAMIGSTSPYFGVGLSKGIEAARGAIEQRYKEDVEKDAPSKMITGEDGTISFLAPGTGKLVTLPGLKGKTKGEGVPSGYRWNADHTALEPIPGGPADPKTVAEKKKAQSAIGMSPEQMSEYGWSPKAIDSAATTYNRTGKMATNLGTREIAAQIRGAIERRSVELLEEQNKTLDDRARDWQAYRSQGTALTRFTSGKQGDIIRSLNVAVDHLGTLERLSEALQNRDFRLFNQIAQAWAEQTGSEVPTDFDTAKLIVVPEILKAITGTGAGALEDRKQLEERFNRAGSPEQLIGAIRNTARPLLGGQLGGLRFQFKKATGLKDQDFDDMLNPNTVEFLRGQEGKKTEKPTEAPPRPPGVPDDAVWDPSTKTWRK